MANKQSQGKVMWNVILLENVSSGTLLQLKNVYFNTDEISFLIFILENAFFFFLKIRGRWFVWLNGIIC